MESQHSVISLMVLIYLFSWSFSDPCVFKYTQQPPSNTNHCSPYHNGFVAITLDCIVRYQNSEFEIRWFRENTAGAVEDLGLGKPNESRANIRWYSRYHDSDFFNQQYNPCYLGKYWCQVINTTADPDQPLMRSNVFTLLAPENYTQPTCFNLSRTIQAVNNVTCADLPVHSEQTTLPGPTTTLMSSCMSSFSQLPDGTTVANNISTTITILIQPSQISTMLLFQPSSMANIQFQSTLVSITTVGSAAPSSVIPSGVPITYVSVGVCAVVLLLIVCSSLIVLLIVIHQWRRRRKKAQSYSTSKDTGYYDITPLPPCKESSAIDESAFTHEPAAYEVPVVSTNNQQQQANEPQYSVVKPVKKSDKGEVFCLSTSSGAIPTLDNPVYMTGCAGGLDHQYSSLNHQVLPATIHDDHIDGQYSQLNTLNY